jgi:hypothetical protein
MFSPMTIHNLIETLSGTPVLKYESGIIDFELRFKLPVNDRDYVKDRRSSIKRYLIENQNSIKGPYGGNIILEIIEEFLENFDVSEYYEGYTDSPAFRNLNRSLKQDGYIIKKYDDHFEIRKMIPEEIDIVSKMTELEELLVKHNFITTKGHFTQAMSAYNRSEWSGTNGQLRTFVESLFDEIAGKLGVIGNSSDARRTGLSTTNPPFFAPCAPTGSKNEWGSNGFVNGFWKRLHTGGSHPGPSDEDDCNFRLHLVMLTANYFMKQFDNWPL